MWCHRLHAACAGRRQDEIKGVECLAEQRTCNHDRLQILSEDAGIVHGLSGIPISTSSDEPSARCRPAVTLGWLVTVPFEIVVKLQLLSHCDVLGGKEANLELSLDHPLLGLAVGLAAMVNEARPIASPASVNHLHCPTSHCLELCNGGRREYQCARRCCALSTWLRLRPTDHVKPIQSPQ
jgi:hypothetical protein